MKIKKPQDNHDIYLWISWGEIPVFSRISGRKSLNKTNRPSVLFSKINLVKNQLNTKL